MSSAHERIIRYIVGRYGWLPARDGHAVEVLGEARK